MKNTLVINYKDFGISDEKAIQIQNAFSPIIAEKEALTQIYNRIIVSEITPELCNEAGELLKKFVKNRTNTTKVHKAEKAFFLAAGRFVDAWKNKNVTSVKIMEEKLIEVAKYYEIKEQKRLAAIQKEREEILAEFMENAHEVTLSLMEEDVWQAYLTAKKDAYFKKIEAEKEIERQAKKAELEHKLRFKTSRLADFIDNYYTISLSDLSETEYKKLVSYAIEKRTAHEKEQELIRLENERLKKEAIAEQKKRKEEERKQRAIHEAQLKKEREEKERIKKELEEKRLAEQKKREEEEKAKQAELDKGDSEKIKDLVYDLQALKTKYSFEADKNKKMFAKVCTIIDNAINTII